MPAGKVEELYATLKKRSSDIYIQRSKLMYQAAPQRTRLFAWSMTNVEFMVSLEEMFQGCLTFLICRSYSISSISCHTKFRY